VDTFDLYTAAITRMCANPRLKTSGDCALQERYPDSEFAVVLQEGVRTTRLFPLATAEEFAESVEKISTLRAALPPSALDMASMRVTEKASAFGVEVPDMFRGRNLPDGGRIFWDADESEFWGGLVSESEKRSAAVAAGAAPKYEALSAFQFDGRTVELTKVSDLFGAESVVKNTDLPSSTRRSAALAIVAGYEAVGGFNRKQALAKTSASVREWAGTEPRQEAHWHMEDRAVAVEGRATQVYGEDAQVKVAECYRTIGANLQVPGADFDKLADAASSLDVVTGYRGLPAHRAVFCGAGEPTRMKTSEGIEWEFGGLTLRKEDIEKLGVLNLSPLNTLFGDELTEKLRTKPSETFDKLTEWQQRAVANFLEENVRVHNYGDVIPRFG